MAARPSASGSTDPLPPKTVPRLEVLTAFQALGGRQELLGLFPRDPVAACVVLPALGIRGEYYRHFAARLADHSIAVVCPDYPGHGASPVRPSRKCDWGFPYLVNEHIPAVEAAVRSVSSLPVIWCGHSLGGQIALMHAGASRAAAGVAVIASGTPYWRLWSGVHRWRIRAASIVLPSLARLFGYYPGDRLGFAGREATQLMVDWAQFARTGKFDLPGFEGDSLLSRCTVPVLSVRLRGDLFAPRNVAEALTAKTGTQRLEEWTWSAPAGVDHNRWPRTPEEPARRLVEWIQGLPDVMSKIAPR